MGCHNSRLSTRHKDYEACEDISDLPTSPVLSDEIPSRSSSHTPSIITRDHLDDQSTECSETEAARARTSTLLEQPQLSAFARSAMMKTDGRTITTCPEAINECHKYDVGTEEKSKKHKHDRTSSKGSTESLEKPSEFLRSAILKTDGRPVGCTPRLDCVPIATLDDDDSEMEELIISDEEDDFATLVDDESLHVSDDEHEVPPILHAFIKTSDATFSDGTLSARGAGSIILYDPSSRGSLSMEMDKYTPRVISQNARLSVLTQEDISQINHSTSIEMGSDPRITKASASTIDEHMSYVPRETPPKSPVRAHHHVIKKDGRRSEGTDRMTILVQDEIDEECTETHLCGMFGSHRMNHFNPCNVQAIPSHRSSQDDRAFGASQTDEFFDHIPVPTDEGRTATTTALNVCSNIRGDAPVQNSGPNSGRKFVNPSESGKENISPRLRQKRGYEAPKRDSICVPILPIPLAVTMGHKHSKKQDSGRWSARDRGRSSDGSNVQKIWDEPYDMEESITTP